MSRKTNHVVAYGHEGGWSVRKSGAIKSSKSFKNKVDAVRYGRELSRKERTELYIHRRDGSIQDRNAYGVDPFKELAN